MVEKLSTLIQGGPERVPHLRSLISRKRGTELKRCVQYYIEFFFQQDDTKIVNFDEGVLILEPFV